MDKTIFRRSVLNEIERYLQTDDIIVLHGPRQVGKTSLLMYLQRELTGRVARTFYIDLEDSRLVAVLDRGVEEFWVVGLNGRPVDVRMIYPWQLYASG